VTRQEAFNDNDKKRRELHIFLEDLKKVGEVDMRWVAIARTHFQEGLSAARRATFPQKEGSL